MKVGDKIDTWFPGGEILSIRRYNGKYPEWFTHFVRVTAPRAESNHKNSSRNRDWLEMAV
jgi:hypothetical protein